MKRVAHAHVLFGLIALLATSSAPIYAGTARKPAPSIRQMTAKASPVQFSPVEPASPSTVTYTVNSEPGTAMIYAVGEGAMPNPKEQPNRAKAYLQAKAYAKMSAIASLVQEAKGTLVSYCASGEDFAADARIKQEIKGVLDCVQVVSARKRPEGGDVIVEVTVRAPKPVPSKPTPTRKALVPSWASETCDTEKCSADEGYTSLVIDAQGLRVAKSMSPRILRPDGSEVWGTVKADLDFITDYGIAAYVRSRGEALANRRAGGNPLVIRAVSRGPSTSRSDVVISDSDADMVLSENRRSGFLAGYCVIVIVGS